MSPLALSPSKIRTYQRCALQLKLQGEPRPDRQRGPAPELALDRLLHDVLERYHGELLRGGSPDAERLVSFLDEAWSGAEHASPEAAEAAHELARQRLARFWAVQSASASRPIAGKRFCSAVIGGAKITCVLDRIDRLPGGELELIDFRSGKPPRSDFDLGRDLAAALSLLAAAADPKISRLGTPVRFTQWFLQNQQRIGIEPSPKDLAWAEEAVAEAVRGIEAGEYPASRGSHCSFCDELERCPAWPETPRQMAGEEPAAFGKRLRASYSKLSLFKSCPRSYSKVYVEKLPTAPKPFFDLGTSVHETLEAFHSAGWRGGDALEGLLEQYDRSFARHQAGYRSDAERETYRSRGRAMLERYHASFVAPSGRAVAHSIEEYFELPLRHSAVLTGYIDRIDRDADGRLTVWDYKTEANERTQEEADEDLQLGIYAWACRRLYGQDVELGLYMLTHDQAIRTRRSAEQLEEVERQVDELSRAILAEQDFEPRLNRHCPDCDWLGDCPLRPEVEAAVASGTLRRAGFGGAEASSL
jgi:RecB family exonuclease